MRYFYSKKIVHNSLGICVKNSFYRFPENSKMAMLFSQKKGKIHLFRFNSCVVRCTW